MANLLLSVRDFLLDILFPYFCLGCSREGQYLCEDCESTLPFFSQQYCLCQNPKRLPFGVKCKTCGHWPLNGLYSALPYDGSLVKRIIRRFKYAPFVKSLAKTSASLIIRHFNLLDKPPVFFAQNAARGQWILVGVPLHKSRLKWRGFNQSEELAKELAGCLKIKHLPDCLSKIKKTPAQAELSAEARERSARDIFLCQEKTAVAGRYVLLVDDVYTTGATMRECARVLKKAGARQVWGVAVARG